MKLYHQTGNIIQRIAWLPLRVLFAVFLNMEIRGIEHVKKLKSNIIFASNHTSEFDPLVIVSSLPFFSRHVPMIYVAREKGLYTRGGWRAKVYGGLAFKLMAALPAYTGLQNYSKALRHHVDAIEHGRSVCIFPIGKHHGDHDIHQARGGVTFLAATTNTPIIPVRITGTENMSTNDFWKRRRKLRITFGEKIHPEELLHINNNYADKDYCEQVAKELMLKIVALDLRN